MKYLLLQHWTGSLGELEYYSSHNIKEYAIRCEADYQLLRGNVFHPKLTAPCQKLVMLTEQFDEYDIVVMLDADMFTRRGMTGNIFTVPGIGMTTDFQKSLLVNMKKRFPTFVNLNYPYWGGAIWKLTRKQRQTLRKHISEKDLLVFNGNYEDEGIMHRLATLSNMKEPNALPGGNSWCHCSYRPGIEQAEMIHIRPKVTPTGPKRPKLENYADLVNRGFIDAPDISILGRYYSLRHSGQLQ